MEAGNQLKIIEHTVAGYPSRTAKNASEADYTIAFAVDSTSRGERFTKKCSRPGRYANVILLVNQQYFFDRSFVEAIVDQLNVYNAKTLNIAGNGIYTLTKYNINQSICDKIILDCLSIIVNSPQLTNSIELIRSGGQTGVDESAIKAAQMLGIPALALLPKGYLMRDIDGVDHLCTLEDTTKRLTV